MRYENVNKQTNKRLKNLHVNIEEMVRSHLISEKHSPMHHFIFGVFILLFGTAIIQVSHIVMIPYCDYITYSVGHIVQGIGAIPVVKSFEKEKGGRV